VNHTEEPWMVNEKGFSTKGLWSAPTVYAADDELRYVAVCACADHMNFHSATDNLANAKRIAACVNACAGISTDTLEKLEVKPSLTSMVEEYRQQRDELLDALKDALSALETIDKRPDWVMDKIRSAVSKFD
jgi:hypothetical protein